jgi:hypothetical protein
VELPQDVLICGVISNRSQRTDCGTEIPLRLDDWRSCRELAYRGFALDRLEELRVTKVASGSRTALGLAIALVLNLILGLWPVVLQRYNRLRLYRAIDARTRLIHLGGSARQNIEGQLPI